MSFHNLRQYLVTYPVPFYMGLCILSYLLGLFIVPNQITSHNQKISSNHIQSVGKFQSFKFPNHTGVGSKEPGPKEFYDLLETSNLTKTRPPLKPGDTGNIHYTAQPFQIVSWYPRIIYYPNFIDEERARHIVQLANKSLAPSLVARTLNDSTKGDGGRTSKGVFLSREQDPEHVLAWVEDKISALTVTPVGNGEPFNVLMYEKGKHYGSHYDYFQESMYGKRESNRVATVLVYLSSPEEGGETVWLLEGKNGLERQENIDFDACDKGYAYKPRNGDAVLFWSLNTNFTLDRRSLHGGCPVKKGEKWVMTKWIETKCQSGSC